MSASTSHIGSRPAREQLQAGFLRLLPRIQVHAAITFRHLKCTHQREDAIAEVVAITWQWYVRLAEQGRDAAAFPSALASLACMAVRSSRRLCGKQRAKDVLSSLTQQRHGFTISPLPQGSSLNGNVFDAALQSNTQTPVPDQVCFRIDFRAWRVSRCERDRRVIDELMAGERTLDVARKHGLTPGRVSQLRRDFMEDWERFCSERDSDQQWPSLP